MRMIRPTAPPAGGAPPGARAPDGGGRPLPASPAGAEGAEGADRAVRFPRCLIGSPDAPRTEHLTASLHCAATRAHFRREGARLKADLLSGRCRVLLTHYARRAGEVPVAVELLKLSEADYPVALMGAFVLATTIDADLTVAHVRLLVEEGGFAADPCGRAEDELALAVIETRRAFHGRAGRNGTPLIGAGTA